MQADINNDSSYRCFSAEICRSAPVSTTYQRHLFDFEKNFDSCGTFEFFMRTWKLCFVFIGVYLVAIFTGRHLMKSRPPFQLRGALLAWNAALAVFSIFCAWRTITALFYQINQESFHLTVCGVYSKQFLDSLGVYVMLFAYSKYVELGDTVFIILRKTPLIFLHWFHHATVTLFVWSSAAYPAVLQNHYMAMNFFVHSIMYSYYVLKVMRIRIPKPVSMAITSLQLFQMLGGLFIVFYTYYMRATSEVGCCVIDESNQIALSIYFAYFVLFGNYFIRTYLFKKRSQLEHERKIN